MDVPAWAIGPILCAGTILIATISLWAAPTRPRLAVRFAWGSLLAAIVLLFAVYLVVKGEQAFVLEYARKLEPGHRKAALAIALARADRHFYIGMGCALFALLTSVRALAITSKPRLGRRWRDAALGMYVMVGVLLLVILLRHDSGRGQLEATDSIDRLEHELLGKSANTSTR